MYYSNQFIAQPFPLQGAVGRHPLNPPSSSFLDYSSYSEFCSRLGGLVVDLSTTLHNHSHESLACSGSGQKGSEKDKPSTASSLPSSSFSTFSRPYCAIGHLTIIQLLRETASTCVHFSPPAWMVVSPFRSTSSLQTFGYQDSIIACQQPLHLCCANTDAYIQTSLCLSNRLCCPS
jgi:hypothetical protein